MRNSCNILIGITEAKKVLENPWCTWEGNIKWGLGERVLRYGLESDGSR